MSKNRIVPAARTTPPPAPATGESAESESVAASPTVDTSANTGRDLSPVQQAILSLDRDVRQTMRFIQEMHARLELTGTFMEALSADLRKLKRAIFEEDE